MMLIREVIDKVKCCYVGKVKGVTIDDNKTRDKILYGNPEIECHGVVTSCWASIDVIKKAIELKANLIIVHEALFYNHGDHVEWLEDNNTFIQKKKLLEDNKIVVWRNHDYVHSGLILNTDLVVDGIFYGFAKKMNWTNYIVNNLNLRCMNYLIPKTTVSELANQIVKVLGLNGAKVIGNPSALVERVTIPYHILGDANDLILEADREDINCLLAMELIDFTLMEYVRDSSMLGLNRSIITVGHFNLEEPGMEFMAEYLNRLFDDLVVTFVKSGDQYEYSVLNK